MSTLLDNDMINELKSYLISGVVEVAFTKVDGTERVMKCTTNPGYIPKELIPKDSSKTVTEEVLTEEVQRVYDIEKNGWRSFRFDSVKNFVVN